MENKKQPEVRFSGFEGVWKKEKFENYIKKSGKKNSKDEKVPAYSVNNKLGLVQQSEQFENSRLDDLDKKSYKFVHPREFAYNPARVNVGSIAFNDLDHSVLVSSLYVVIKMSNSIDNEYILQYIKSRDFLDEVRRNTEGSVREYLFFENFKNVRFPYVENLEEQQKIGSFFKLFDKTIFSHQQELAMLKQTKQGFLQKMFPEVGKKVPEVRFPDFTDDWEDKRLENVIDVKSGRDYKHLNNGDIPVYGTGGYMLSVDEALSSEEDAIGIGRKGTIDKPYLLRAPFWTVDTLFYSIPKKGYDLDFVNDIFHRVNWKKMDESTGVPSLSKAVINAVHVQIPSFEEQQKIGSFFKNLDEIISFHQRELELLQLTKKAFLQKLFV